MFGSWPVPAGSTAAAAAGTPGSAGPAAGAAAGASIVKVTSRGAEATPSTDWVTESVCGPGVRSAGNGTLQRPPATRTCGTMERTTARAPTPVPPAPACAAPTGVPSIATDTSAPSTPVPEIVSGRASWLKCKPSAIDDTAGAAGTTVKVLRGGRTVHDAVGRLDGVHCVSCAIDRLHGNGNRPLAVRLDRRGTGRRRR